MHNLFHLHERVTVAVALTTLAVAAATMVWPAAGAQTSRTAAAVLPGRVDLPPDVVGAVTTVRRTAVRVAPDEDSAIVSKLRTGILVPVSGAKDGAYRVLTPCHVDGWVRASDVTPHPVRGDGPPVIVLDAGHGGAQQPGAVGVRGLPEKDVNLDVVRRTQTLLGGPRADPIRIFVTRSQDHIAGLGFRSHLANALDADALISIHHNAAPDGPSEVPGTETYYQLRSKDSKRLAGLLYEELFGTLREIEAPWVSDNDAGAKYRANRRGTDFYSVLRETRVPSVIVEALFLSNPPEEVLLRDERVRQAIADSVHRGVVRFLETDAPGSGFVKPKPQSDAGPRGRLPANCVDPV